MSDLPSYPVDNAPACDHCGGGTEWDLDMAEPIEYYGWCNDCESITYAPDSWA